MTSTIGRLENLLKAEYRVFRNAYTGEQQVRTLEYGLPKELQDHISMIHPTTRIGSPKAFKSRIKYVAPASKPGLQKSPAADASTIDPTCDFSITPACLRDLYSLGNPPLEAIAKLGIGGVLEQWAQFSDLESFLAK